jgi:hypothetical protein
LLRFDSRKFISSDECKKGKKAMAEIEVAAALGKKATNDAGIYFYFYGFEKNNEKSERWITSKIKANARKKGLKRFLFCESPFFAYLSFGLANKQKTHSTAKLLSPL